MEIKQTTRQIARNTVKNLVAKGMLAKVVDLGTNASVGNRWVVRVLETATPTSKVAKVSRKKTVAWVNKGFDIRKVATGVKGFDLFYDSVFLNRRDTRLDCYELALELAHKEKLDITNLKY